MTIKCIPAAPVSLVTDCNEEKSVLKLAYSMFWEMGDPKASRVQFAVNGLKHAKLLACAFQ